MINQIDKSKTKVEDLVEFSEKHNEIWGSGDYETKVTVQKLIFPKGIVINPVEREYRTSDLNSIFRLIHSFTGDDEDRNKKRTGRNIDPSCLVDNSIEISNLNFCLIEFRNTIEAIEKIMSPSHIS